jgi:hypothetical protein
MVKNLRLPTSNLLFLDDSIETLEDGLFIHDSLTVDIEPDETWNFVMAATTRIIFLSLSMLLIDILLQLLYHV